MCGECISDNDEKYSTASTISQQSDDNNRVDVVISETNRQSEYAITMIASRDRPRFYKSERWKTFVTFLLLIFSFFVALLSLSVTHDRVPDRKTYKPLPDVFLDNFDSVDYLLNVTEIQIIVSVNLCIIFVLFHKNRWVWRPPASILFFSVGQCANLLTSLFIYFLDSQIASSSQNDAFSFLVYSTFIDRSPCSSPCYRYLPRLITVVPKVMWRHPSSSSNERDHYF